MPELPEVQTTVNDLTKKIIGRRIVRVWDDSPKQVLVLGKKNKVLNELAGLRITKIVRRGKYILIYLGNKSNHEKIILAHLKLTGRLLIGRWQVNKDRSVVRVDPARSQDYLKDYIRVLFYFDNGQMLAFSDVRRFGRVVIGDAEKILSLLSIKKLGPEPLHPGFSPEEFTKKVKSRKKSVKQTLLDQTVIVGIGNIYADETLWRAKVHPQKLAHRLSDEECRRILREMRFILEDAIRLRGTSFRDFRDPQGQPGGFKNKLAVYQRTGEPCFRCKTVIKRIKFGGRSAHFCPNCQAR